MNVSQPLVQASLVGEAIDHGPVLVFVADEELSYVAVNQRACDILGYSREELLGLKVTDVSPSADTADRFAGLVAAAQKSCSIRLRRKDGREVTLDYVAAKTTVAGMQLFVSVGFVRDEPDGSVAPTKH
jgi:PAS domain S-box-containing protein